MHNADTGRCWCVNYHLTKPKVSAYSPVQDGLERVPIQVHCSLLLQRSDTHFTEATHSLCVCAAYSFPPDSCGKCMTRTKHLLIAALQCMQSQLASFPCLASTTTMDQFDTVAPSVDLTDQPELADILQSSRFVSILAGLAFVLLALGKLNMSLDDAFVRMRLTLRGMQGCYGWYCQEEKGRVCYCLVHQDLGKQLCSFS